MSYQVWLGGRAAARDVMPQAPEPFEMSSGTSLFLIVFFCFCFSLFKKCLCSSEGCLEWFLCCFLMICSDFSSFLEF